MIGQLTNITNWYILHRLKPQFLSRIQSFIVFGECGTEVLLITKDNAVFGFGLNKFGCLGLGHKDEIFEPTEIIELRSKQVISLVHGIKHVLALTATGEIFSWGDNNYGQLGNMNTFESLRPILVGKHIAAVQCGSNHTLALTKTGQVFAWGRNNYGQIGIGNNTNQLIPTKITDLEPNYVTMIACGSSHSLALTSDGNLYAWGNNSFGQLGIGNCTHQTVPIQVKTAFKLIATSVTCGMHHTLMLTNNGEIYAFGRNECGQLGCPSVPGNEGSCSPVKVYSTNRFKTIAADFASNLSTAISQCGYCFVWGECANEDGPIRQPRETPLISIHDSFAIYSKHRNTPSLLLVEDELFRQKTINRIVDKLARSFNDPHSSDLQFVIDERTIYVHRWFLKISSKYFEKMLSETWCNPESNKIEINAYSYDIYFAYLRYIYTDCIEVSVEEAVELLDLANCYLEDDLKSKCINIIRNNLSVDNCCQLYKLSLEYSLADFEKYVVTFAFNNIFDVCRSQGFRDMNSDYCKCLLISVSDIA